MATTKIKQQKTQPAIVSVNNQSKHNSFHIASYVLSIIAAIVLPLSTIGCLIGGIFMVINHDNWINQLTDDIWKNINPKPDGLTYDEIWESVTVIYNGAIGSLFFCSAWGIFGLVVNAIAAKKIATTMQGGKYTMPIYILQLFFIPLGLISGILMLVAQHRAKSK